MHFLPFRLRVIDHTLQFKQPAGTSRGVYTTRRVWYIVLISADPAVRFTGLGECAPLPDLSCDYTPDYEALVRSICEEVERTQQLDAERWRTYPSILMGLQTAFRSAVGSLRGDYRMLYPSGLTRGERGIPINGLVWMGTYEEMCRRMEEKLSAGFRCVKLKIGAIDFESELSLIKQLRARYSVADVELRVDANGAFAPKEALAKLEALARYDIHSIEQPIRQGQWKELATLCAQSPLPIALDEELIGIHTPEEKAAMLDAVRPQYIVLKPSLHGAFTGAAEWINLAKERHIGYWVTSALESAVGLNAIAQWCAAITPEDAMPQGLGTGQLFVKNVAHFPLFIEGDSLWYGTARDRSFKQEVAAFSRRWLDPSPTLTVQTSGSTGQPRPYEVDKARMWHSALATINALGLQPGNTALLAMPLQYIAGQMMVVRSFAGELQLLSVAPTSHPYASLHEAPDFAALTPMQVYESLKVPHERSLMRRTLCLIIGGGAISPALADALKTFPHKVYSTYGMTETLSHIALRRLNGAEASDEYMPMPGVNVTLSPSGTLVIHAPALHEAPLVTNDLAVLTPAGGFRILGRRDNVICSGGIKLQIEEIERKLGDLSVPYQITAVPDDRLGEAVTLLYVADEDLHNVLEAHCRERLSPYEVPRHYLRTSSLPRTDTGKPARARARQVALSALHVAEYTERHNEGEPHTSHFSL